MKRTLALMCVFFLIFSLSSCKGNITGEQELVMRARKELKISNADTAHLVIAGHHEIKDECLFWFVSGNEHQAHTYLPIEFKLLGKNQYAFVKTHKPVERGMDICALMWNGGYSFIVNNQKCRQIRIDTQNIPVGNIPFVYYHNGPLSSYDFLDELGNVL
jgi:hypothetical protein